MKFSLLLLLMFLAVRALAFTEWYVDKSIGTNVNSGHTPDANPTFTADSGNWTNATWTFFKTALNPVTGGVTNGAWASICTNLTATNAWLVGYITNASDTTDTIQFSRVNFMGVNPADRIGDCVIRVGGAWAGPNTNTMANGGGFPFAFLTQNATNTPTALPRCNFKGGTVYGISNAITHGIAGAPCRFQGYTSTPGDGGKANIDGGTTLAGYTLLTVSGSAIAIELVDLIFSNNGGSGNGDLVAFTAGNRHYVWRCSFHDSRSSGLYSSASGTYVQESEAYLCNKANTAALGGFRSDVFGVVYNRCKSHHHGQSNGHGFVTSAGTSSQATFIDCLSFGNAGSGIFHNGSASAIVTGCGLYQNNSSGFDSANAAASEIFIENSSFLLNAAFGINSSGGTIRGGQIFNCAFGTGAQTNGSGSIAANVITQTNSLILLPADQIPWVDVSVGDFRINSSSVKAMGRGLYTYYTTNSPTVAYPDIGAAQSASTNVTTRATSFSQ